MRGWSLRVARQEGAVARAAVRLRLVSKETVWAMAEKELLLDTGAAAHESTRPAPLSSQVALELLKDIDRQLQVMSRALNPLQNRLPTEPDLDDHTVQRLVALKMDLQLRRASTAELVHECLRREHSRTPRERRLEREQQENMQALQAAMAMLQHQEEHQEELQC